MLDELNVSRLYEGFDQLLAQADQLVSMRRRKSVLLGDGADFFTGDVEEVDVRRKGAQEVEDVVAPVVAHDPLALDGGDQLHRFVLVVENAMRVDF